jgi:hypothetical protein
MEDMLVRSTEEKESRGVLSGVVEAASSTRDVGDDGVEGSEVGVVEANRTPAPLRSIMEAGLDRRRGIDLNGEVEIRERRGLARVCLYCTCEEENCVSY